MIEFKFRVWNKTTKEMYDDYTFHEHASVNEQFNDYYDDIIFMQWTGYNDKNGVGIYVEDFVNCNRYENQEDFIVKIKDIRQLPKEMFGSNLNWLEVVGNSFENGGRPKK